MRGTPYLLRIMIGLRKPKITRLGVDVAGQVEAVGRNVTQFKPEDEVFAACRGAFAEYACTSESSLVTKPNNVPFEQTGSVPVAALTALQASPPRFALLNHLGTWSRSSRIDAAQHRGADLARSTHA
jgi:NADPH:quinone reductase-like Zn-dependent oxidoreductase